MEIAIIAAYCVTRNLRDVQLRNSIISKTVKQYKNNQQHTDKTTLKYLNSPLVVFPLNVVANLIKLYKK